LDLKINHSYLQKSIDDKYNMLMVNTNELDENQKILFDNQKVIKSIMDKHEEKIDELMKAVEHITIDISIIKMIANISKGPESLQ
jgi:hypothetical protein